MAEHWNWRDHYEDRDRDGNEVVYVQKDGANYAVVYYGAVIICSNASNLITKVKTKKLRPWTFAEVPVGAVVRHKERNGEQMIVGKEPKTLGYEIPIYVAHYGTYTPVSIMDHFTMLDGSPCGAEDWPC